MVPGIDPKVDYAFKRLFGREQNVALLIHLLNAILNLPPGQRIVALQILNPFNDKDDLDDKLSILDIKARDQTGRLFNIEMQLVGYIAFCPRVLYYWAKLHQGQMLEGMGYHELRPTISICFVNTAVFPDVPAYHLEFELRERQFPVAFTDQLQVHILELAKFKLRAEELTTAVDRWLYFLCHAEELDTKRLPPTMDHPEIHQALGELSTMTQTELERDRYESRLKMQRDIAAAMAEARIEVRVQEISRHIRGYQRMLQLGETPQNQLCSMALDELERLEQHLETAVGKKLASNG
jgi:predicted transposase/invertase (TIGR01784 family)